MTTQQKILQIDGTLTNGMVNSTTNVDYSELECYYSGTDFLEVKIYIIGVFAATLAVISFFFNAFFTFVFIQNASLRRSPLYYFGILAALDTIMAVNYLALMAVPVYMDQFNSIWLYHLFLQYLRPMLTLSNFAMFASVLMILLATTERFLRTFHSKNLSSLRRFLERCRPQVCLCLILLAISYKICTYFEIEITEHENCQDWMRFEIMQTDLARNPNYRFWWVFVARNLIDRIIPFFALVLMNFLIIKTLKREHKRANLSSPTGQETFHVVTSTKKKSKFRTISKKRAKRTNSQNAGNVDDNSNKKNLKDATRALLAIVMMYLMSQTLQVIITFVEAFWKNTLEEEYTQLYSFINDLMSILTLLSSALRFPVYCSISSPISQASYETLRQIFRRPKKIPLKSITTLPDAVLLLNHDNNNSMGNSFNENTNNDESLTKKQLLNDGVLISDCSKKQQDQHENGQHQANHNHYMPLFASSAKAQQNSNKKNYEHKLNYNDNNSKNNNNNDNNGGNRALVIVSLAAFDEV